MVAVVQLVEHQVVILGVAGSSPVSHPDEGPNLLFFRLGPYTFLALFLAPWIKVADCVWDFSLPHSAFATL